MKIGVIGSGFVGATAAYAMVMRGVGRHIVLVDIDKKRAQAEANDIMHAVPFAGQLKVVAGDYQDLAGSQVVVITAGVSQKPGETRLDLLVRNAKVFQQVVPGVLEYAPDTVLLVATNPVDVMTHIAAHYASQFGVPFSRVLGTGCTLDTARFRALLGLRLGIDSDHVHAYVIGEHGDSEVLAWSLVTIGGIPLDKFCNAHDIALCADDFEEIENQVRQAAYHIIDGKGATYYGIGSAIARIVEVVVRNQRSILTVCTPLEAVEGIENVTLSLPNLIGGEGHLDTFYPDLNDHERNALKESAQILKNAFNELNLESINEG
jgi:L-lactate dehydrogenase